jgi:hypothetical protein
MLQLTIFATWLEPVIGLTLLLLGGAVAMYGPLRARPAGHCSVLIGAGLCLGVAGVILNIFLLLVITLAAGAGYLVWARMPALGTLAGTVIATFAMGNFHSNMAVLEATAMPSVLSEVHEVSGSSLIALEGVEIRSDLLGQYRVPRNETYIISIVAPLVPVGWTRAEPVPAWVTVGGSQEVKQSEQSREESGDPLMVFPIVRQGNWAIGRALKGHQLTEIEGARLVRRAPSKAAVLRWRLMGRVVFAVTWLWMIVVTVGRRDSARFGPNRRKPV